MIFSNGEVWQKKLVKRIAIEDIKKDTLMMVKLGKGSW
jgi:hypothetical protein